MNALVLLPAALSLALLVRPAHLVLRFNRRMPALWGLLEAKERGYRVRELHTSAWSNLPAARYLYNDIDFEDPEIRELKLALEQRHRSAITNLLFFMVTSTLTVAVWLSMRSAA